MKRNLVVSFIGMILLMGFVVALDPCDLDVTLLNQDPYPAVQGDSVKLVFQIQGIKSTSCQNLKVELVEAYPFTLDPGSEESYQITSGTFSKDYSSSFLAPFKVRVDESALDGENPVELRYTYGSSTPGQQTKTFQIEVQDVRADFEIFVEDYSHTTHSIVFEILNIGEADIEALTVEIPEQEGVTIEGANKNIVGDLNSNEDTSAEFKLSTEESQIRLNLIYSDVNNERRTIQKTVVFNSGNFTQEKQSSSAWKWVLGIIIIGGIVYWHYKKKKKHSQQHSQHKKAQVLMK